MSFITRSQIAYERAGKGGGVPIVLVHAGVADRRMWDGIWRDLTAQHDVVRVDFRGYGESTAQPHGSWSPRDDVRSVLIETGIERAHLVGCSYGAGVCTELALEHPELVASLLLAAPGGSLLTQRTDDFARFLTAENDALERGDIDAAAEVNVVHWVDGPHRGPDVVPTVVREAIREMQRRAFEITIPWPDSIWEAADELTPEPTERLKDIGAPMLVLSGGLDMDTVHVTADLLAAEVPQVRRVDWPEVAHLPPMERPEDFAALVLDWVD